MRDITTICLDKTGTLTEGKPKVVEVISDESSRDTVLATAAAVDLASEHPIARAIVNAAKDEGLDLEAVTEFKAWPGEGVSARIGEREVIMGKEGFLTDRDIDTSAFSVKVLEHQEAGHTVIFIASKGNAIGAIAVADTIKESSPGAVRAFKKCGLNVVMITGDNEKTAQSVAEELGIDRRYAHPG
jgi:Cu+-exporting ATPase